jgi:hypothetical protein
MLPECWKVMLGSGSHAARSSDSEPWPPGEKSREGSMRWSVLQGERHLEHWSTTM